MSNSEILIFIDTRIESNNFSLIFTDVKIKNIRFFLTYYNILEMNVFLIEYLLTSKLEC